MSKRKTMEQPKEERMSLLDPLSVKGSINCLWSSLNDTFIHATDLSGRETLVRITADRDEPSPYAAVLASQDVAQRCKLGITALHVKLRATGGNKIKTPGPGAQSALRALA